MCSVIKLKVVQKRLTKIEPIRPLLVFAIGFIAFTTSAQKYTVLHTFGTNEMGQMPVAGLIQGPDGVLYGTTSAGGLFGYGQVFKVNPDGSGYTSLKDFNGVDCANPSASLLLSGNALYGTACYGGTNGFGAVFKLNTDGSNFRLLKQFTNDDDGGYPNCSLILSGANLYGTLWYGGDNHFSGAIFKIGTDGNDYKKLYVFSDSTPSSWINTDGSSPVGLVMVSNVLYGTASSGGNFGCGTIFKLNTDGSGFNKLVDFEGNLGNWPQPGLATDGTVLYGSTAGGGEFGNGVLFSLNTDGTGFTVFKTFTNSATDGANPNGYLLLRNSTLYGATTSGGPDSCGNVFEINTDGTGFGVLISFTNSYNGFYPYGGLILSGADLYGTGSQGGAYGYGALFKISVNGSGYNNFVNFKGGDGAGPTALAVSGSTIYGITSGGGGSGFGTLFSIGADGTGYSLLKDFTNIMEGVEPACVPVIDGPTIYGSTSLSSDGYGALYKLGTNGGGFTVLKYFTNDLDGCWPCGALALSGTTLFGATQQGGISNNGTIFKINTDGTGYVVLKQFTGADGNGPAAGVVLYNGTLYGTTFNGGTNDYGTVFSLGTNGENFAVLKQFTPDWTGDGASPTWILLSNDTIYGICTSGGFGYGNLFRLNLDGSGYSIVDNFTNELESVFPVGQLCLSRSTLFGTTALGGKFGCGTIFQINDDGTGFAMLKQFTFDDGAYAQGGLILSGSTLYGTAGGGGSLNGGVLFALSLLPEITATAENRTAEAGGTTLLKMRADGSPPISYQWLCDGTNLTTGCWTNGLKLSDLQCDQSGTYVLVITNAFGAATSAPVQLSVIPKVERRSVPAINLTGAIGDTLAVQYTGDLSGSANWVTLDTVILTNTSQFYCDASDPLPSSRYYRSWRSDTNTPAPSLDLPGLVPAISLNGNTGDSLEVDCINVIGPTNAWTALATVTLTNTPQLYFDLSALGQPARLYRILSVP